MTPARSQIEADKVRLDFEPMHALHLVTTISSVKPQAQKSGALLEAKSPAQMLPAVQGDPKIACDRWW